MLEAFNQLIRHLGKLRSNVRGGIAISFAIALPMLLGIVGLAADYAMLSKIRSELQEVADASAMAGAREIPLAKSNPTQVASAVRSFAAYRLTDNSAATTEDLGARNYSVKVEVLDDFSAVDVKISETWTPFFAHFVSAGVTPVAVSSKARFVGRNNICVLGLSKSGTNVYLDNGSRLTGNDCGVFSNSTAGAALRVDSGATLKAVIVCTAGGASVSGSASVDPVPITDCPPVDDPLADRSAPNVGGCDHNDLVLDGVTKTIYPGVYCGGINISGSADITLNPGTYIIKDGGVSVVGQARLSGTGAGFYITGSAKGTYFGPGSHISLEAPSSGPMAGLLIFEDRKLAASLKHRITSDDARKLIGTIYLPVGSLLVDSKQPVADQSAYTAIVVSSMELNSGPNLILNSDYETTDVPVPNGIAGSSQVVLSN
jgi:Flp pilus assembly protein TadG